MQTKWVLIVLIVATIISTTAAFYRFWVERDYLVLANVPCDPGLHSCFIGDGENTPDFYSITERKAFTIPACDGWKDECPILSCTGAPPGTCTEIFCDPGGGDPCHGTEE